MCTSDIKMIKSPSPLSPSPPSCPPPPIEKDIDTDLIGLVPGDTDRLGRVVIEHDRSLLGISIEPYGLSVYVFSLYSFIQYTGNRNSEAQVLKIGLSQTVRADTYGSLLFMSRTRSSGEPLLPFNPEPHLIERIANQQEAERLAALANAQLNLQNTDNLERPKRQAIHFNLEDDDDDLDGAGATGDIIPPPLSPGTKFNITSTMIQLVQLKGLFGGLVGYDLNMYLVNFVSTCMAFNNPGVGQNTIRLCVFPLSLSEEAIYVVDNAAGGSFMDLSFTEASGMLDRMTKQGRAWYTRESGVARSIISIGTTTEQRRREEEHD
ncbi:hypothetical protein FXO38_27989 [Capsicum annuum]|nr:hypothetical protein FXO38_27989 [Capsicum annuum]